MASLKSLSKSCDFETLNKSLVRDIFVVGLSDTALQIRLLNTADLTLAKTLEICLVKAVVTQNSKVFTDTTACLKEPNNKTEAVCRFY